MALYCKKPCWLLLTRLRKASAMSGLMRMSRLHTKSLAGRLSLSNAPQVQQRAYSQRTVPETLTSCRQAAWQPSRQQGGCSQARQQPRWPLGARSLAQSAAETQAGGKQSADSSTESCRQCVPHTVLPCLPTLLLILRWATNSTGSCRQCASQQAH